MGVRLFVRIKGTECSKWLNAAAGVLLELHLTQRDQTSLSEIRFSQITYTYISLKKLNLYDLYCSYSLINHIMKPFLEKCINHSMDLVLYQVNSVKPDSCIMSSL